MKKKSAGVPCEDQPKTIVTPEGEAIKFHQRRAGSPFAWAYGVTTTPERRSDLLPRTLASLARTGFDRPHLFVDGTRDVADWVREFGLEVTAHYPPLRTFGKWVVSMWELYCRYPTADRYAMFQDDLVAVRNLRSYLEACDYPDDTYQNLYTFPSNQRIVPKVNGREQIGWYESNQLGKGAVALVFSRPAIVTLLGSMHMSARPMDPRRGHRAVDGGIVTALQKAGYKELVHNPSLVQHTGKVTTMGSKPHPLAPSFPGENYDALELLPRDDTESSAEAGGDAEAVAEEAPDPAGAAASAAGIPDDSSAA